MKRSCGKAVDDMNKVGQNHTLPTFMLFGVKHPSSRGLEEHIEFNPVEFGRETFFDHDDTRRDMRQMPPPADPHDNGEC